MTAADLTPTELAIAQQALEGRTNGQTPVELDEDTWEPVNLAPILSGDVHQPQPDIMIRHDGEALIYQGHINGIHGSSGDGKGWVVCDTIARQIRRGQPTILLDYEDIASSIVARLKGLDLTDQQIIDHLIYIRPQQGAPPSIIHRLTTLIRERNVRLIVIDSIGEAFSIEGIDEDKDKEVGPWLRAVCRPLADAGAAVLIIDHSTKANDNPLFPSGSKRKRAAITGASYYAESMVPFVKGQGGRLRLTCAKDRHGNYRRGETAAYLVMESHQSGSMDLTLYAPSPTESTTDLPALLAARAAVKTAKSEGGALSQESLVGLMKIKAGTPTKRAGIQLAVDRGALEETAGPRRARLFTYRNELPEVTEPTDLARPRPTSPGAKSPASPNDLAYSPPPIGGEVSEVGAPPKATTKTSPRPGEVEDELEPPF